MAYAWNPNDRTCRLVLQLCDELRDVGAFCSHWNGPAQFAFAQYVERLGKPIDQITVAELKAAAAYADAELKGMQARGLI
ncbi:hypothetical protein D3C84_641770 [compost metagenome]